MLKRLLDAGMTFTAMTQARAEELIRDLVRAGEVQAEQAQAVRDELVERSRRNSERLIDAVRSEIRQQMSNLGLATTGDVARLERRVTELGERVNTLSARGARAPAKAAKATKATKATKAKKSAKKATGAKKATRGRKATKAAKTTTRSSSGR